MKKYLIIILSFISVIGCFFSIKKTFPPSTAADAPATSEDMKTIINKLDSLFIISKPKPNLVLTDTVFYRCIDKNNVFAISNHPGKKKVIIRNIYQMPRLRYAIADPPYKQMTNEEVEAQKNEFINIKPGEPIFVKWPGQTSLTVTTTGTTSVPLGRSQSYYDSVNASKHTQ